jgi:hypothetical protein
VPLLPAEKKTKPLILNAENYHKTVHIRLPEGFTVDEMPDCGKLTTSFGSFACSIKQEPGAVVLTQDVSRRKFFNAIAGFEEQPIVLVKN